MAKAVGSVEVHVGAKVDALQKELLKARGDLEKFSASTKREMTKSSESSRSFVKAIGGIKIAAAAATAAIGAMLVRSAGLGDQIAKTSRALGVGSDQYQAWGKSANLAGVDQSVFDRGLARLNRAIGDANRGLKTYVDAFARVGIATRNADGSAKDAQSVFLELADKLKGIKNESDRAAISAELLVDQTGRMAEFMRAGSVEITSMSDEMRRLGLIIDKDTLTALEKAADELDIILTRANVASATIAAVFVPALSAMNRAAEAASSSLLDLQNGMRNIAESFAAAENPVRTLDDEIANLNATISGLSSIPKDIITTRQLQTLIQARRKLAKLQEIAADFQTPEPAATAPPTVDRTLQSERSRSRSDRLRGIFDKRTEANKATIDESVQISGPSTAIGKLSERGGRAGFKSDIDEMAEQARESFSTSIADGLVTGITQGGTAMKQAFTSLLTDLASQALSSTFASMIGSLFPGAGGGGIGGGIGGLFAGGGAAAAAPGFATGGQFRVGGSGGADSQLVAFRASPDETVSIRRPDQMGGGGPIVINNAMTVNGSLRDEERAQLRIEQDRNNRRLKAELIDLNRRGRFA